MIMIMSNELKALGSNILFKEIDNPFIRKTTDGGLEISGGLHFSGDSGEIELSDKIIGCGIVLTAGPECKELAAGDLVYYDRRGPRPIVYKDSILWCTNELNAFSYIKEYEA